ncbi:Alpha/Beta hydrolase fold [Russula decolorans]
MIGNSWPEYVFIRTSITALRLIAPLSIIYLAASYHAAAFLWSPFLGVYALVEAAFYLFVYLPRSFYLQQDTIHPPRMSRAEREALFHKCAESMTPESITGWFLRSPGLQISRDNVIDWLLWALFSVRNRDTNPEWEDELGYYITVMGEYVGYPLIAGSTPEIQCLRLTMDPVPMVHRPFTWYMLVCFVDTLTSIALYFQGFTHYNTRKWFHVFPPRPLLALFSRKSRDTETNIPYWYRPHRSCTKLPILFIHGIGIGLLPYIPFLRDLAVQDSDVGILAIEILPISMRLTAPPLNRDAMCAAITRILNAHGLHRVVLAGHSYGTAVSAHLLHNSNGSSDLIAATLLIDPIPFLLHYPAVAYNFVYRQPWHANEWQLWYFASREPDTARALSRHFFWFECILFREDKRPMPVTVSLSGRDQIVDARAVRAYLTGSKDPEEEGQANPAGKGRAGLLPSRWKQDGLEVLYFPELDHATVIDTPRDRAPLLGTLRRFVRLDEEEEEEDDEGTKSVSGAGAAAGAMLNGDLVDVE